MSGLTSTAGAARYPSVLSWRSAGSVPLDDAAGLAALWGTWQSQMADMESVAKGRGWQVEPVLLSSPASQQAMQLLDAQLRERMGRGLPAQLRWLMARAATCSFGWSIPAEDMPTGDLEPCAQGGGVLWDLGQVDITGEVLTSWVDDWVAELEEDEQDAEAQEMQTFWSKHLGFLDLPNGDLLTLDMRSGDDDCRPVRYFSHEQDGLHGCVMAPDLFELLSNWISLGCVGTEWYCWDLFVSGEEPNNTRLADTHPMALTWRAWLAGDSGPRPEGGPTQPKRVRAETPADFALLKAAAEGNTQALESALASGAQVNCTDLDDYLKDEKTAVVLAAERNDLVMLDLLLQHGASLATHALPLRKAISGANGETLLWLIRAGARIDPWPDDRFCALTEMLNARHLSMDEYLAVLDAMLAAGPDPDVGLDRKSVAAQTTLLMRAGHLTQARLLVAGANPHFRDLQGCTAMHYAKSSKQIKLLVEYGLDVNDASTPPAGETSVRPLHAALGGWVERPPIEAVEAFLEAGADPALTDSLGNNAWAYCQHLACAKLLAQRLPFDASWRNALGQTCLHYALASGHRIPSYSVDFWPQMVQWGLEIDAQDADGNTALHVIAGHCISEHDLPSIRLLLDLGASKEIRNLQGEAPWDLLKKKFHGPVKALKPH